MGLCYIPHMTKAPTLKPRLSAMGPRLTRPAVDRVRGETWQTIRKAQLQREPLCRHCQAAGRVTLALEVDHIRPLFEGGHPTDPANLQSLCVPCHQAKSRDELARRHGK